VDFEDILGTTLENSEMENLDCLDEVSTSSETPTYDGISDGEPALMSFIDMEENDAHSPWNVIDEGKTWNTLFQSSCWHYYHIEKEFKSRKTVSGEVRTSDDLKISLLHFVNSTHLSGVGKEKLLQLLHSIAPSLPWKNWAQVQKEVHLPVK
jgi:hypothetical protein